MKTLKELEDAYSFLRDPVIGAAIEMVKERDDRVDELEWTLTRIVQWSDAYPLDVFPKPDYAKARELLEAGGMTLDAIAADCMRHVVERVGDIARSAFTEEKKE